jgi:hypothetical protein
LNNDNENSRNAFYSLYVNILRYWFPSTEGYDICPQWPVPDCMSVHSAIPFVIEHNQRVLLLIEVNAPSKFQLAGARDFAISLVLQRLDEIGQDIQADRLYAISAFGTGWRAWYTLNGNGSAGAEPVVGVGEVNSLKSAEPNCWNPDITSDASWAALQGIVEIIKENVALMSLNNVSFSFKVLHGTDSLTA